MIILTRCTRNQCASQCGRSTKTNGTNNFNRLNTWATKGYEGFSIFPKQFSELLCFRRRQRSLMGCLIC